MITAKHLAEILNVDVTEVRRIARELLIFGPEFKPFQVKRIARELARSSEA